MFLLLLHRILLLLLILQALCATISDNNNNNITNVKYTVETSRILTDSSPPKKYLLIIPGFGGRPSRAEALRHTMSFYPSEDWDCLLFVYKSINISLPCEHIDSPGFFAQHMRLVRPEFIVRRKYQMVVVHVDDVVFLPSFEFSWSALLKFMVATGVDSVSPRVNRAGLWRLMDPRDNATKLATNCPGLFKNETTCDWNGYDVPQLEIFVQAFTPLMWICFWDTLDTSINTGNNTLTHILSTHPNTNTLPTHVITILYQSTNDTLLHPSSHSNTTLHHTI